MRNKAYTRGDRRRDDRRESRLVYTLQVFVAATNTIEQPTGEQPRRSPVVYTRGDRRGDNRDDRLPRRSSRVYAL